jgi:hypothetical protein
MLAASSDLRHDAITLTRPGDEGGAGELVRSAELSPCTAVAISR